ncbi:MAG: roadblock/LC7 domain-containing protein [Candidatus Aquicultor sp.]
MDERDFAELISVFLKGNEPDETPEDKASDETGTAETKQASSEAEIRKNIIEALAEKIKGSQSAEDAGIESQSNDLEEPESAEEDTPEQIFPGITGNEEPGAEEFAVSEPAQNISDILVTKEEVDKLLSKNEPEEIVTLQQILHRFTDLDGVIAVLLVTRDGFTVDFSSNIELDLDIISAVVATGFGSLDKVGYELNQGALSTAMLEFENGPVVIAPIVPDIALVVVASQWTTLGRIRWEIKKRSDELIASL